MALVAAWKSGAGDFFSFLGRLTGSWARIARPSGWAPVLFLAAAASSSISLDRRWGCQMGVPGAQVTEMELELALSGRSGGQPIWTGNQSLRSRPLVTQWVL
jgi:hypothetical protein